MFEFTQLVSLSSQAKQISFNFTPKTLKQWEQIQSKIKFCNWFQTWSYAQGNLALNQLNTRWATIELGSKEIGFFALEFVELGPIKIYNIVRGPLFFENENTLENFEYFALQIKKYIKPNLWTRLRWLVEPLQTENSDFYLEQQKQILQQFGFKKQSGTFATRHLIWPTSEAEKLKQMTSKWRNSYKRSRNLLEKNNVKIIVKRTLDPIEKEIFKFQMKEHQKFKNYKGLHPDFWQKETIEAEKSFLSWYALAYKNDQLISGIYFLQHGISASYRVGWTQNEYKNLSPHYCLFFDLFNQMQTHKINHVDLGGCLDQADSVNHFKSGLKSQLILSPGQFSF